MSKKTKEMANNIDNIVAANVIEDANIIGSSSDSSADSSAVLPLVDSVVISDQIEAGDTEAVKKRDCMDLIRNNYRAPVPTAAVLLGRFFRAGLPSDNKEVIKLSQDLGNLNLNDDFSVASFVFGLSAPVASAVSRAANAWWRIEGDFEEATVKDVVEFANNNTSLSSEVYFCNIKPDWLFIDSRLVVYSATNNNGEKNMLLPGCYYTFVDESTANYIRAVGSVGVYLDAKRREMNGKISNVFALRPAVSGYIKKILLAGFLSASDIADIAQEVEKEIQQEKDDKKAVLTAAVIQKEFELTETQRLYDETRAKISNDGLGVAKYKKLQKLLNVYDQKLSAVKTSLSVARLDLKKLEK